MSLVGPVWADFMMHNVTNDVMMLHFVEEGNDIFYVSTYNKYGLETHGYTQKSLMFWRCLFPVTARLRQAQYGEALTACENCATYVLRNASCHIGEEPDYDVERMGWFCNWRWRTTHGDEHRAFKKKLTLKVFKSGRINIPKELDDWHKLRHYSSLVVSHCHKNLYSSSVKGLMESYALKIADDLLLCIVASAVFWVEQTCYGLDSGMG
ncbi:hypothetical protein Tco_0845482 [Tanacetum coccineum]